MSPIFIGEFTLTTNTIELIWSISEHVIMVFSMYLTLAPLRQAKKVSRTAYVVLLLLTLVLTIFLGIIYQQKPEWLYAYNEYMGLMFLACANAIMLILLLSVVKTAPTRTLTLFFIAELISLSIIKVALVADATFGDNTFTDYLMTWTGAGVQWGLVIFIYIIFKKYFRDNIAYMIINSEVVESFWQLGWLLSFVSYLFEGFVIPDKAADLMGYAGIQIVLTSIILILLYVVIIQLCHGLVCRYVELNKRVKDNQLLELKLEYAKGLTSRIEEARRARHDLRHFQQTAVILAQEGDLDKIRTYARELERDLPGTAPLVWCKNDTANAIIDHYAKRASDLGADVNVEANVADIAGLSSLQLTLILGNIMENAVEALKRCVLRKAQLSEEIKGGDVKPMGIDKHLVFTIRMSASLDQPLLLDVRNSCVDDVKRDEKGHLISSKHEGLGVGTQSVRVLTEKLGGFTRYTVEDGIFRTFVMIPPQKEEEP